MKISISSHMQAGTAAAEVPVDLTRPWRNFGIEHTAYYLPGSPVSIETWAKECELNDDVLTHFHRNGNVTIHRANGLSSADLAEKALAALLKDGQIDPLEIDLLCLTATMPMSAPAAGASTCAELKRKFGLKKALAFGFGQLNCTSLVGAILMLTRLAASRPEISTIALVTSDVMHGEAYRNRHLTDMQSDGAAALILKRDCRRNRLGSIEIDCLPGYHMGFDRVPHLAIKLRALWPKIVASLIRRAIAAAPIPAANFTTLVPLNTNHAMWTPHARMLDRGDEFIFAQNIGRCGHVCCADAIINLTDAGLLDIQPNAGVVGVTMSSTAAFSAFTIHGPIMDNS